MFSFFKSKKTIIPAPEWAFFFDDAEYTKFITEIETYFKSQRHQFEISDGIVHVNKNEFGFENLGLSNVAQVCKQHGVNH